MNRKGQAVFFAAIMGLGAIIVFFVALPTLLSFISYGISQTDNAFAKFLMSITPFFIFIMIIWGIIAIARSE
jgi:hypothetical protein